jgi:transcriptional regulator with XRE-family HTH domain
MIDHSKLREPRETAGLSKAELARRSGLNGATIGPLENGRRSGASGRAVNGLARALGVSPLDLLAPVSDR